MFARSTLYGFIGGQFVRVKFHFTSLWAAAAVSTSRSSPMPPLPYSLSIAHGSNVVDAPVPDRPRDDGDANASVCADAELIWSAFT